MAHAVVVAVPVLDGARHLPALIAAVRRQRAAPAFDLLAVDSGSTDGSVALLRAAGVRVIEIPNAEFGHGRTRNLIMSESTADFTAFLTQDAAPVGEHWLAALLEPFADTSVAATYGPQIPRPDADARTARIISAIYRGSASTIRDAGDARPLFSDVNSCLRRTAWERVPFRQVAYAEDFYLAQDLLESGWALAYAPGAAVWHSNSYTLVEHFGRMADEVASLNSAPWPTSWRATMRTVLRETRHDAAYAWHRSRRRFVRDTAWAAIAESQRWGLVHLRSRRPATFARFHARTSLEAKRRQAALSLRR